MYKHRRIPRLIRITGKLSAQLTAEQKIAEICYVQKKLRGDNDHEK